MLHRQSVTWPFWNRTLCQVQQQIEEIDFEEDSRDQFEADFIATKSTLLKRAMLASALALRTPS